MAPALCRSVLGSFAGLRRNPDAIKTIVALGLYCIMSNTPTTIVASDLQGEFWGERMSEYSSMVNFAMYTLAIFATGPLGSIGDAYGNRVAVAIVVLFMLLPVVALLAFGPTELGLNAWAVARVISGLSGTSMSGSAALYALINEVSGPAEVETTLGLAFSATSLFMMVGNSIGLAIERRCPENPRAVLLFAGACGVAVLALLTTIRPRSRKAQGEGATDIELATVDPAPSQEDTERAPPKSKDGGRKRGCVAIEALRFALTDPALRRLCFTAALVSVPETVLFDVQLQFSFDTLGIMGQAAGDSAKRVMVSSMVSDSVNVGILLCGYSAGLIAKTYSSRSFMLCLIPFLALLNGLPALLAAWPSEAMVVAGSLMLGLTFAVLTPLQAFAAQVAPPDRISEAFGALGAFKSLSSLLGNLVVFALVPLLQSTGLPHPLWVLYPVCGMLSFIAFFLVRGIPESAATKDAPGAQEMEEADDKQTESTASGSFDGASEAAVSTGSCSPSQEGV